MTSTEEVQVCDFTDSSLVDVLRRSAVLRLWTPFEEMKVRSKNSKDSEFGRRFSSFYIKKNTPLMKGLLADDVMLIS